MTRLATYGVLVVWLLLASYVSADAAGATALDPEVVGSLLVGTVVFCFVTLKIEGIKFFSLYGVVLASMAAFMAAHAFVLPFEVDASVTAKRFLIFYQFSPDIVAFTFVIVGVFISAFHAGAFWMRSVRERSIWSIDSPDVVRRLTLITTYAFLVATPFSLWQLYQTMEVALSSGYFALFDPNAAQTQSVAGTLANFAVPMAVYVVALRRDAIRWVAVVYICLFAAVMLLVGARAWGALALLALAWTYTRTGGGLPRWFFGVSAVGLVALFPAIAATRNIPLEQLTIGAIADAYTDIGNPVISLLAETGFSATTVAWTVTLVPVERPFGYGISFVYALTSIAPNLFFDTHPAVQHSLSQWLSWRVEPEFAARGGGLGYSMFAELYYNFGIAIGALAAFGLGALTRSISSAAQSARQSDAIIAVCGVLFTFLPFVVRNDSTMLFRPIAWYILLPILISVLTTRPLVNRARAMRGGS